MDIQHEIEEAIKPHFIHPKVMELLVKRVSEMVSSGRCTRLEELIYDLEESLPDEEISESETSSGDLIDE